MDPLRIARLFDVPVDLLDSGPYRGIITALPVSTETAPPLTLEAMQRTMTEWLGREWPTRRPSQPSEFRCAEGVMELLADGLQLGPNGSAVGASSLFGIRVVEDPEMEPDEWRLVDDDGCVLHSSRGRLAELPPNPFWMLEPRNGYGDAASMETEPGADILSRIDAAVEAWESGPDAYRYAPEA